MIKYDSISKDKDGKVLVIVINGKAITDRDEINKIIGTKKKKEVKDE